MERLNIDEAITHAKEVAKENKYKSENSIFHNNDKDEINALSCCAEEHEQLAEWLEELKRYKGLEEQGFLLKLRCKVGDTVYEIQPLTNKITPRTINGIMICHAPNLTILYKSGYGYINVQEDFGKTVFLTQAEAEEALKEMERKD